LYINIGSDVECRLRVKSGEFFIEGERCLKVLRMERFFSIIIFEKTAVNEHLYSPMAEMTIQYNKRIQKAINICTKILK